MKGLMKLLMLAYVLLEEKNFYQNFLQKLQPEN